VPKALKINSRDNVAVLLAAAQKGDRVEVLPDAVRESLAARCDVPFGHKIALVRMEIDQPIMKYGEEIGRARTAIEAGDWVHLHNVYCRRGHE
jgi:altronate dehydratase small subunit